MCASTGREEIPAAGEAAAATAEAAVDGERERSTAMPSRRKQLKPRHVDAEEDNETEVTEASTVEPEGTNVGSGAGSTELDREDVVDEADSDPVARRTQLTAVQLATETAISSDVDDVTGAGKFDAMAFVKLPARNRYSQWQL